MYIHFVVAFKLFTNNILHVLHFFRPFPSHIGNVDMIRIRAAEKMILEEETSQGRMMRDGYGRLVPEAARASIDSRNNAINDCNSIFLERPILVEKRKSKSFCINGEKRSSFKSVILDRKGLIKGK